MLQYIDVQCFNSSEPIYIVSKIFRHKSKKGKKWEIPQGFVSDGRSNKILKSDARTNAPAFMHDWDYYCQVKTKRQSDWDYKNNLIEFGVPRIKAYTDYIGLIIFGKDAWNKNKERMANKGWFRKILTKQEIYYVKSQKNMDINYFI